MCGSKTGTTDKMKSLPYKELVGCILYCCLTRPDICSTISELVKYSADPGMPMWRAGLHLLKYLHSTSSMGLVFNPSSPTSQGDFRGFSDSGFNGSKDTGRSRCGHLVYFRSCLVGFKSLIQRANISPLVKLSIWLLRNSPRMLSSSACLRQSWDFLKRSRHSW